MIYKEGIIVRTIRPNETIVLIPFPNSTGNYNGITSRYSPFSQEAFIDEIERIRQEHYAQNS